MVNNRKRKAVSDEPSVAPKEAKKKRSAKKTAPAKEETPIRGKENATTSAAVLPSQQSISSLITEPSWSDKLQPLLTDANFQKIEDYLNTQWSAGQAVHPPRALIFEAFNQTPFDQVKVVLLGQDPYHDDEQAHGLAFSVQRTVKTLPPSLKNIFKELSSDIPSFRTPHHGCLEKWAKSGVLLLNASLTVQEHVANSHSRIGWIQFTDGVIRILSDQRQGLVFLLWGGFAHSKEKLIDSKKHTIIKTAHPSPLSFNKFANCKCFSRVNTALESHGQSPIDWSLE